MREDAAINPVLLCEINTTPLIDVMLVMLVTLIVTLPIVTHAVRIELPAAAASADPVRRGVVDLEIDADGTLAWNGEALTSPQELEARLRAAASRSPQPEVHVRAERRTRYGVVASVLAAVQRNRIQALGFADTAAFGN